jgi:hypothetical protein
VHFLMFFPSQQVQLLGVGEDSNPRWHSTNSGSLSTGSGEALSRIFSNILMLFVSVPDPDPPDPHVFGPSGFTSQRSGSGSGSFCHQAKIVRKTLIHTVLWLLLDFLSLKNDVNITSKSSRKTFF